jgi:hypothetical protein
MVLDLAAVYVITVDSWLPEVNRNCLAWPCTALLQPGPSDRRMSAIRCGGAGRIRGGAAQYRVRVVCSVHVFRARWGGNFLEPIVACEIE